jgi:hypothetical protein
VRPLTQVRRDLTPRYANAVMRAMSPRAEDRWPALGDLLTELEGPARSSTKAALWVWLGVGAAIAAAAAGAYYLKTVVETPSQSVAITSEPADSVAESAPTSTPQASASDGSPPAAPPPDAQREEAPLAGIESSPEVVASVSQSDVVQPTPAPAPARKDPAAAPVKVASADTSAATRRRECIAQCERDDGECRSINRRARQDCMRAVGFGATGGFTTTPGQLTVDCGFYGQARCSYASDHEACLARIGARYSECVSALSGNVASRRQDCDNNSREADRLCLDELRDCRTYCQ